MSDSFKKKGVTSTVNHPVLTIVLMLPSKLKQALRPCSPPLKHAVGNHCNDLLCVHAERQSAGSKVEFLSCDSHLKKNGTYWFTCLEELFFF